ncbi:MAG: septal ring lytic transglycosylase RlpA family protein [Candidatus Obscuribacterales bacterium]|nr:septal ring lytic transglycosylase RlpA family protein [Candidatus Obscuribacterales bacterium]
MHAPHLVSISFCLILASAPKAIAETPAEKLKQAFSGVAQFYSDKLHGQKTASGQVHDREEMVAAHKNLPFGTRVRVKNIRNGKSCVVVINDRGPFGKGVIDVSRAAAQKLGFVSRGKTKVDCTVIARNQSEVSL